MLNTVYLRSALFIFFGITLLLCWPKENSLSPFANVDRSAVLSKTESPFYDKHSITTPNVKNVHSSNIIEMKNGDMYAVWFGGTREGHKDTQLYASIYSKGKWQTPWSIMTKSQTEQLTGRYIRKLGNPVPYLLADGNIGLMFVSVSIGGWATSQLNWAISSDQGKTFDNIKRIVTSPFNNISTLVRSHGIVLDDQKIGFGIYHEIKETHLWWLQIDQAGNVERLLRGQSEKNALAPVFVPTNKQYAEIFSRTMPSGMMQKASMSLSEEKIINGKSTNIPNPNSSFDIAKLSNNQWIKVFNPGPKGRKKLHLSQSTDQGSTWQFVHEFENGSGSYAYPSLKVSKKGMVHLTYTDSRLSIVHHLFNTSWLALSESKKLEYLP